MIDVEEYYAQAEETAANSNNVSKWSAGSKSAFPFEGINIGVFESLEYSPNQHHKAPALLPLADLTGICFLYDSYDKELINNSLQTTALHLAASLSKGLCQVVAYDPIGLGSNLIALSNVSSKITGGSIITDSREFTTALLKVKNSIPTVIQKVLGFKYKNLNLVDYNKENDHKEPYTILVLSDFPNNYTNEQFETLSQILKNGRQAGVYVLMSYDTEFVPTSLNGREDPPEFHHILDNITTIYRRFESYQIHNIENEEFLHKFTLHLDDNIRVLNNLETVYRKIQSKENAEEKLPAIPLFDYLPQTREELWGRNSARAMMIPVGRDRTNEEVGLEITQKEAQNATIVVGMPGSGKSVFLNTLITSTAFYYSPKQVDLYLIDFSGVEFNVYAPKSLSPEETYILPHAKVIAPESEREFGISVLRRILDEGRNRQRLFSDAGVSDFADYWDYCIEHELETLPRVLLIVDEFQKFFEGEYDKIALEAEKIIKIIVKEYRKFGINLVLATQTIGPYASKIDLGDIGNRVAFAWNSSDGHEIFKGHEPTELVANVGDCIYNKRGGSEDYNKPLRSYYVSSKILRTKLKSLYDIAQKEDLVNKNTIVFRSDAKVYIHENKTLDAVQPTGSPKAIKVYLGENIEISDEHVSVPLSMTMASSEDNILIIGGRNDVSERIAINCARSLHAYFTPGTAAFIFFDYTPTDDIYHKTLESMYYSPFDTVYYPNESTESWMILKDEIARRLQNPDEKHEYMFITVLALQYAHSMYTKNYKLSDEAAAITTVLEQGPRVGIFTIIQVDILKSLSERISAKAYDYCNHRIALQMRSDDSQKILGSNKANEQLYIEGKESSLNRAFYFNRRNETYVKFRPYELDTL